MSIEEIVTGYHAAMVHKSADELAGLYAEDGRHEFPFGGLAAYEGREEIRAGYRAMWGATGFEAKEVRRVALHHTLDPEVVVVEQETLVSAGERSITVPSLVVLRVRDGRIVHARDYIVHARDYMDTGVIAQVRAAAGA